MVLGCKGEQALLWGGGDSKPQSDHSHKNFKAGGGAASIDTTRAQVKTSLRMGVQQKTLTTRERAGNNLGPRILYQCP